MHVTKPNIVNIINIRSEARVGLPQQSYYIRAGSYLIHLLTSAEGSVLYILILLNSYILSVKYSNMLREHYTMPRSQES